MPEWFGPALMVVVLVVVIPVGVLMSGAVAAAILGTFIKNDVDKRFEGTEELALSQKS
ncbi:MAG: hypothetical protein N2037_03835 [Acidimicrobiales bacterium]|nr:hypothetical protein [Acidimicrobiales bacterium]